MCNVQIVIYFFKFIVAWIKTSMPNIHLTGFFCWSMGTVWQRMKKKQDDGIMPTEDIINLYKYILLIF